MKKYKFNGKLLDRLIKLKAGSLDLKKSSVRTSLCCTLGITKQTISNWIKNNNSPGADTLIWLKEYFGLDSIEDFFIEDK